MKIYLTAAIVMSPFVFAQNAAQKLDASVKNLLSGQAAYSANLSVYVADEAGNKVYDYAAEKGLSTASTQKIFTAACALETLGKNYHYTTTASYTGDLSGGVVAGDLVISSNGDPTLGSWRYDGYKPENFKQKLLDALKQNGISKISGNIIVDDSFFDAQTVPGGWPWDDMGNYYGAGVWGVNWRENQFDINMNGSRIKNFNVDLPGVSWINEAKTAGTSDQSLIFTAPHSSVAMINGNLPAKNITVSGAMPNPPLVLGSEVKNWLSENNIAVGGSVTAASEILISSGKVPNLSKKTTFFSYDSPSLDKIVFWFLRKSINLYGETLIKTLAREKGRSGSFNAGVDYLKSFWKSKGINGSMINFADGSGLSPQNYVSAKAEVQALIYAKKQPWFAEFYDGFPTMENGMKMKSGTMKNTKSYAGYYASKDGKKYVFSIIINNYQGSDAGMALQNMLNALK